METIFRKRPMGDQGSREDDFYPSETEQYENMSTKEKLSFGADIVFSRVKCLMKNSAFVGFMTCLFLLVVYLIFHSIQTRDEFYKNQLGNVIPIKVPVELNRDTPYPEFLNEIEMSMREHFNSNRNVYKAVSFYESSNTQSNRTRVSFEYDCGVSILHMRRRDPLRLALLKIGGQLTFIINPEYRCVLEEDEPSKDYAFINTTELTSLCQLEQKNKTRCRKIKVGFYSHGWTETRQFLLSDKMESLCFQILDSHLSEHCYCSSSCKNNFN